MPIVVISVFALPETQSFDVELSDLDLQDWQTGGLQLIYGFAYAALLLLLPYNRYSVDYAMKKKTKS